MREQVTFIHFSLRKDASVVTGTHFPDWLTFGNLGKRQKKHLVRLIKCYILLVWSRLRPFGDMEVWERCVLVCLSGMKGWWSVIVGEWVELYLCWTGCPWFCWLSGYIQTGTWQQACNTRPSQPTKDARTGNKKKEKSIKKNVAAWQRKDTEWVNEAKSNHFHRWNHNKRGGRGYQKMFFRFFFW